MTFQVQHADNEAIEFVLNNLWERGQEELQIIGITPGIAAETILARRERGEPTFSFRAGDEPVFIAGLTRTDDPQAMATWFQATEAFNEHAREITCRLRQGIEDIARAHNLTYVEIFSACVHPKTGRWFKALGFDLDLDYHCRAKTGAPMYRFVRHFEGNHVLRQA